MKLFTNIVLNNLINFMDNQLNELKQLKLNKFINNKEEIYLFQNINIYTKEKNMEHNDWNLINEQANKSIYEQERLEKLNDSISNVNLLTEELSKQENFDELMEIESIIAEEDYRNEEQKQVQELLNKFYQEEHPEKSLPEFKNQEQYINFVTTTLIHNFILNDNNIINSHYAFISDFFPVNNIGISSLIKEVRKSIQQNKITPAINIYKAWLKYLKNNNENYYQYDWHNFNDQGQYINDISNHNELDIYININDQILMYDEVKDKKKEEEQFQQYVNKILSDGTYKSNFKELQQFYANKQREKELYVN